MQTSLITIESGFYAVIIGRATLYYSHGRLIALQPLGTELMYVTKALWLSESTPHILIVSTNQVTTDIPIDQDTLEELALSTIGA